MLSCTITKSKYAVFYDKSECIGSAKIIQTHSSLYDQNFAGPVVNSDKLFNKKYTVNT